MAPIQIVLAVDRRHVTGCSVTMQSVLENVNPASALHFHVAVDGISARDRARLMATVVPRATLEFWEFDRSRVLHLTRSRIISHSAYARFFVGEIVPPGESRCIYLDSDLIVERDVSELRGFPLDGRTLGAVENLWAEEQAEHQARLGLSAPRYFNSGVLLIDLERWRARDVMRRALDAGARLGHDLILHDQDALNCTLDADWVALPSAWNVAVFNPALTGESAAVFHYMGAPKPWEVDYDGPFAEKFVKYLRLSPYAEVRPWNPAGLGRMLARMRRRLPSLGGTLRVLERRLRSPRNAG